MRTETGSSRTRIAGSRPGLRTLAREARERYRTAPRLLLWGWFASLVAFLAIFAVTGNFHLLFIPGAASVVVCCVWNRWTQWFIGGATPFLAQGLIYELTGVARSLFGARPVHVAEPYQLERSWFGIPTAAGIVTPNEYFAVHHWSWVDLITGSTYIVYIYEVVALLLFLSFTRHRPGRSVLLRRFGWAFFWMSVVGYALYHLYPAAPPWYVSEYGFAAPHAGVVANPAGALRWDQLTGLHYFEHYYRFTTDVFGAIPSLHVAFSAIVFFYATELRKRWLTAASGLLLALMCFSAVYLQHHYVVDALAGLLLAMAAWGLERLITLLKERAVRRKTPQGLMAAVDRADGRPERASGRLSGVLEVAPAPSGFSRNGRAGKQANSWSR